MNSSACLALTVLMTSSAMAEDVALTRYELPNGIRVVLAQVPQATQQTTFTFLPLTIANDQQDRAQWSHLIEHMVIRSTDPDPAKTGDIDVNGETTATYLRLDTYAKADQWKQALERHATWLGAQKFDAATLEREKGMIAAEEQNTAKGGYTTKFALAAWNQAVSFGIKNVPVHGDIAAAQLVDVQGYETARVPHDQSVMIASIGPADMQQVWAEMQRLFGPLPKKPWAPVSASQPGDLKPGEPWSITWDLPTRHAIWWWPLPNQNPATLGAAYLLARTIQVQQQLKPQRDPRIRQLVAYPCVVTPRGAFLVIDACLALPGEIPNLKAGVPEIRRDEVLAELQAAVKAMHPDEPGHQAIVWTSTNLSQQMPVKPDFQAIRKQLQPAMRERAEAVWLLSMMNFEYQFNVNCNIAIGSVTNVEPGSLQSLLDAVQGKPAGTMELLPEKPASAPAPATTAPAR